MKKYFHLFIIIGFLFTSSLPNSFIFINKAMASDEVVEKPVSIEPHPILEIGERRLFLYQPPEQYFDSFERPIEFSSIISDLPSIMHSNIGEKKIAVIGGGLTYDDLAQGSRSLIINGDVAKTRLKPYPKNAFLIDLDQTFFL